MRRAITLAAFVAFACAGDPVRSAIEAEIEKGVNAIMKKDMDTYIDQIPDASLGDNPSTIALARDAVRESLREEWLKTTTRNISVDIESVESAADSAIVVSTMKWDRIMKTADGADTVISDIKHRELWRLTGKGWRSFKVLSMSGTRTTNGKIEYVGQ
jgi:hypothetical protein